MASDSDDEISLHPDTLKALMEFMAENQAIKEREEALNNEVTWIIKKLVLIIETDVFTITRVFRLILKFNFKKIGNSRNFG
jgi:hypothetical protein